MGDSPARREVDRLLTFALMRAAEIDDNHDATALDKKRSKMPIPIHNSGSL
jgi:hypothetical protein